MEKLNKILGEMDRYDWDSVQNYEVINPHYEESIKKIWIKNLELFEIKLEGLVLDVCCGPVSLGTLYDNVIAYDINPSYIKGLRKNNIRAILGDFRDIPLSDNTFDMCICFGPPSIPYKDIELTAENCDYKELVYEVTSELIRVSKKNVFLVNMAYSTSYLPYHFRHLIEKKDKHCILYNKEK